jgi:hypothetical protein
MILSDPKTSTSFTTGGTTRWMSPELFDPGVQDSSPTKHSDCYALGMVIYEVLSGHVPFYQFVNLVVPGMIFGGKRPGRPEGSEGAWFTDDVWTMLERCWTHQPNDRPGIEDVLQCLEEASQVLMPPSSQAVVNPSTDPPTSNSFDIKTGQSTGLDEASSPFRVAPPQPLEKLPLKGDTDDSSLHPSAH